MLSAYVVTHSALRSYVTETMRASFWDGNADARHPREARQTMLWLRNPPVTLGIPVKHCKCKCPRIKYHGINFPTLAAFFPWSQDIIFFIIESWPFLWPKMAQQWNILDPVEDFCGFVWTWETGKGRRKMALSIIDFWERSWRMMKHWMLGYPKFSDKLKWRWYRTNMAVYATNWCGDAVREW